MLEGRAQRNAQAKFRGRWTSVARTYAETSKINVRLQGHSAYIDLKKGIINMPGAIEYLEGEARKAMEGILDHEVGHAVEERECQEAGWRTPGEILDEILAARDVPLKQMFNVFEDLRMERRRGDAHPGIRFNFEVAHRFYQGKHQADWLAGNYPSAFRMICLGILHRSSIGRSMSGTPDYINEVLDLLQPQISRSRIVDRPDEAYALARETITRLKEIDDERRKKAREEGPQPRPEQTGDEGDEDPATSYDDFTEWDDEDDEDDEGEDDDLDLEDRDEDEDDVEIDRDFEQEAFLPENEGDDSLDSGNGEGDPEEEDEGDPKEGDGESDDEGEGEDEIEGNPDDTPDVNRNSLSNEPRAEGDDDESDLPMEEASSAQTPEEQSLFDAIDDDGDWSSELTDELVDEASSEMKSGAAWFYPHPLAIEQDRIVVPVEQPVVYMDAKRKADAVVGKMSRRLTRWLKAQSRVVVPDQRHGDLDDSMLVEIEMGSDRVFQGERPGLDLDTAWTILIDQSGSMIGERIAGARVTAIALGETLDRCGIPFEMWGFSNQGYGLVGDLTREEEEQYTQVTPNDFFQYKTFDERWRATAKRTGSIQYRDRTDDVGAIRFAGRRLLDRRETWKVMMVICDGMTEHMGTNYYGPCTGTRGVKSDDFGFLQLKDTVALAQDCGIYTVGIGIGSGAQHVARVYDRSISVGNIGDLAPGVFRVVREIVSRHAKRARRGVL